MEHLLNGAQGAPDQAARARMAQRLNAVAKPLKSLGAFEEILIDIAGMLGDGDYTSLKKAVIVLCADHGVVAEGVTQTDSSVTAVVTRNLAEGTSNVNAMARAAGADVIPVDVGVLQDVEHPGLIARRIRRGTGNMAVEPAMSRDEALRALNIGVELVGEAKIMGYRLLATGEMGIGNTTAASAVLSALLRVAPKDVTGRGAGLSNEGLKRKVSAIERALAFHQPDPEDPIAVLSAVGGLEIGAMAGVFLGGMAHRVPVVIDGVISLAAALLAARIAPGARQYMIASHESGEPAARRALDAMGLRAVISAGMSLGEGTGAVMLFPLIDLSLAVLNQGHTFEAIEIEAYRELGDDET